MIDKSAYDALLWETCVNYGFGVCIEKGKLLHVDHFIPSSAAPR